ncbi:toll/interleukin-1 receptor domain-containing protein [Peribacillus sp. Hz7]|uniref:toll/interleukin-1 receptor domain-containing protein n=1 Tax=Peribacillus sp. Hz7 TaxID=3344873 RepID=UPI0035C96A9E
MQRQHKKVFVSYSWDSSDHQAWIRYFTNELRGRGVDANCDQFILQRQTKNLNQMMIEGIRDNDYVIYVLTENYKNKADDFQGGVGFEQLLSLPIVRRTPDKMILIKRSSGSFEDVLPFHLEDYPVFDFSNDKEFESNMKQLVYRIHGVDYFEVAPLGPIPDLTPQSVEKPFILNKQLDWLSNIEVSVPKKITDYDKSLFMETAFKEICEKIRELLEHVKKQNPHITYTIEWSGDKKLITKLYMDGAHKTGIKMWLGNWMGSHTENIHISYGPHLSTSDQSYNELITCEVTQEHQLLLKAMIGNFYSHEQTPFYTPEKLVMQIWEHHLKHYLK